MSILFIPSHTFWYASAAYQVSLFDLYSNGESRESEMVLELTKGMIIRYLQYPNLAK